jgi:hypothetical protein
MASVGWRGDVDHRIEMLELRCALLEEQRERWQEAKEGE